MDFHPGISQSYEFNALLDSMQARFNSLQGYQCIYESYTANEDKSQTLVFRYYFKKPAQVRMEILEGSYPGTIMIYNPEISRDSVKVKAGGQTINLLKNIVYGEFFPVQDKKVIDLRGNTVSESDWGCFIHEHINFRTLGQGIYMGDQQINGYNTHYYLVYSDHPEITNSVKKEEIWVDTETLFPVRYIHYDRAGKILRRSEYRNLLINPALDAAMFREF
jgi:outer membrane lipoprotein-sorting protein